MQNLTEREDYSGHSADEVIELMGMLARQYSIHSEDETLAIVRRGFALLTDQRAQYHDLLYQVATKHPGESRHDTAKRYIQQAEQGGSEENRGSARSDSVLLRDNRASTEQNSPD